MSCPVQCASDAPESAGEPESSGEESSGRKHGSLRTGHTTQGDVLHKPDTPSDPPAWIFWTIPGFKHSCLLFPDTNVAGCQNHSFGEGSRQISTQQYVIAVPTSPALISSQRAKANRGLTVRGNLVHGFRPENGAAALRGDPKRMATAGGTTRSC